MLYNILKSTVTDGQGVNTSTTRQVRLPRKKPMANILLRGSGGEEVKFE